MRFDLFQDILDHFSRKRWTKSKEGHVSCFSSFLKNLYHNHHALFFYDSTINKNIEAQIARKLFRSKAHWSFDFWTFSEDISEG